MQLLDDQGITSTHLLKLNTIVRQFYENFFNPSNREELDPWEGDAEPLTNPFTITEVKAAITKLRNRRACGEDQIYAEYLKYGGESVATWITKIFNSIFEQHQSLDAIGTGLLLPLNKPGKPKTVDNTRAITLLNIVRKTLSIVVLQRVYPDIDQYLSPSQSGFRRKRSTADVVWSYRWIDAIAKRFDEKFNIMGIDMSKAFDSIYREKLMTILEEVVPDKSNRRILRYLLSQTTLQPNLNGELGDKFKTKLGTPQGGALSPVLFTIYLEGVLREFRRVAQYETTAECMDTGYADDVDFINKYKEANEEHLRILAEELPKSGLIINSGKTEFIDISTNSRPNVRKLGSRIDSDNDVMNRMTASNVAFKKLRELRKRKRYLSVEAKLKLYNATVVPMLTYNLGSNAAHADMMRKMDIIHRKHLRQIINLYYPNMLSSKKLYERCKTKPMSQQIRTMRWQLFGHIMRLPRDAPPQYLMDRYMQLTETTKCKRGGQYLTLPRLLNKEIKMIGRTFINMEDLEEMRTIAADRAGWIELRKELEKKWERKDQVNEAKRKLAILLTPARTQREAEENNDERVMMQQNTRENEDDQDGRQSAKRLRIETEFIIKVKKRTIEVIERATTNEEEVELLRLWKKKRQPSGEEINR